MNSFFLLLFFLCQHTHNFLLPFSFFSEISFLLFFRLLNCMEYNNNNIIYFGLSDDTFVYHKDKYENVNFWWWKYSIVPHFPLYNTDKKYIYLYNYVFSSLHQWSVFCFLLQSGLKIKHKIMKMINSSFYSSFSLSSFIFFFFFFNDKMGNFRW